MQGGQTKFFTKKEEKGDKHEKGGDAKIGGCHFFNCFRFQSHLWCVGRSKASLNPLMLPAIVQFLSPLR